MHVEVTIPVPATPEQWDLLRRLAAARHEAVADTDRRDGSSQGLRGAADGRRRVVEWLDH